MHFSGFLTGAVLSSMTTVIASPLLDNCLIQYRLCQRLATDNIQTCDFHFQECAQWLYHGEPDFEFDCSGLLDGDYPHPTKCTHYVACVAQTHAYEMICALSNDGNPLHFVAESGPSPASARCDYPEVAGCAGAPDESLENAESHNCKSIGQAFKGGQVVLAGAEKCTDVDVGDFCNGKKRGEYPDPNDCTKYVVCQKDEDDGGLTMYCPLGPGGVRFWFDSETSSCVWPQNAACDASCPGR
ncbi:hypothetical protein BT63DRAFT_477975 [Microthyrium microscopicum]|uniref:Chitin-binding type-2 domain-containing protein n=1 Tax=Microthyrium microscopicum TaxID=703497 RepID=A0A6A6UH38_9PEZI|nr:hypothetical protein BT63DRAFT_477975 [Microthyrium microscopicum]